MGVYLRQSLAAKFAVFTTAGTALIAALIVAWSYLIFEDLFVRRADEQALGLAATLGYSLDLLADRGEILPLQRIAEMTVAQRDIRAMFFADRAGRVIAHNDHGSIGANIASGQFSQVVTALHTAALRDGVQQNRRSGDMLLTATPLRGMIYDTEANTSAIGVAFIEVDVDRFRQRLLAKYQPATVALVLLVGVLGMLTLLWVDRLVLRRIRKLARIMADVESSARQACDGGGLSSSRVHRRAEPADDIDHLGQAFAAMLDTQHGVEEALRISEARYRALVEQVSDWIWECDANLRFTVMAGSCRRVVGRDPEWYVGKSFEEVFAGVDSRPLLFDHLAARQVFRNVLLSSHHVDGRQVHLGWTGEPVFDASGGFLGYRGTGHDLSREVEARREADCLRRRLFDAIEAIPDGFVLWDADDRLVMCNTAARRFQQTIADGMVPGVRFDGLLDLAVDRGQYQITGSAEDWKAERRRRRHAGAGAAELHLGDGRWLLVADHGTEEGGIVSIETDITDLVESNIRLAQRENALAQSATELEANARELSRFAAELMAERDRANAANLAKSQFLATMSHELRTPLNAVLGFSEMLREQVFGPLGSPNYLDYAQHIHSSGRHLLSLINDVLDMSKIEAGRYELDVGEVDLAQVVNEILTMTAGRAADGGVVMEYDIPSGLPAIQADARAIKQVLINLLGNAVKFTGRDGTVRISVRATADQMVIQVADTGIGITPQDIERVFEPFVQVQREHNAYHEGTGLGLSLAKAMVRLHHGDIAIASQPGEGTTVTVTLPRRSA